ncbi:MAG: hypothetical protein WCY89_06305 [Flavobacteriaceae bacterium]
MKKLFFLRKTVLVGILLFGLSTTAQSLVKPTQVTPQYLKTLFENAKIQVEETAPDHIKIRQIYQLSLDIDSRKRFIVIKTSYALKENVSEQKALALVNRLNTEIPLTKISYDKASNSLFYVYHFWIEKGFSAQGLITATEFFSRLISLSFDKDKEGLINS